MKVYKYIGLLALLVASLNAATVVEITQELNDRPREWWLYILEDDESSMYATGRYHPTELSVITEDNNEVFWGGGSVGQVLGLYNGDTEFILSEEFSLVGINYIVVDFPTNHTLRLRGLDELGDIPNTSPVRTPDGGGSGMLLALGGLVLSLGRRLVC